MIIQDTSKIDLKLSKDEIFFFFFSTLLLSVSVLMLSALVV